MKKHHSLALIFAAIGLLLLSSGCRSVSESPAAISDSGPPQVVGKEPAPAPIPQQSVPDGDSSLKKTGPDQRIDQPKS